MKKSEAEKLVNDTFTQAYDEARFRRFIHELFHDYEKEDKKASSGTYIPEAFQEGIHSYKRLAKFTDPEGLELDVLAVKVPRRNTLENARTMQRNFIARYLNGSRGGNMKDAALVAFYSDDCDDWRFSLVRMDYVLDEEKQKVRKELTPARRYSFLVGKHEKTHTARKQLLPVLQSNTETTLSELEAAFNIEKVTKEFFEKYKALYLSLKEALEKHLEKNSVTKTEFETKAIKTDDFAKRLLGQIVFLYFLQKKGWLGVAKGNEWGTGPKDFLQSLYREEYGEYQNFFNDVLEPLFYEALATERTDNYYNKLNCRIPFLNGGLFEAIRNYDWVNTDILLDNAIFQEIFDIFDLYNFTVREDEPLDKEVAVDPEMLGKVFENLIPENERKGSGTYYTPREIVHYMCQESLINYLDAKLNIESHQVEEKGQQSLIPDFGKTDLLTNYEDVYAPVVLRDDLAEFIYHGDVAQEHDATAQVKTQNENYKGDYQHRIPETVRKYASQIDDALAHVKICDPAIGSGAFPVGVMNEIVRARGSLNAYLGDEGRTPYDFKRHAIQESIYGVDIEASAVDIAKLRLWLSLVVDEEDFGNIKPLPNLEYKIVAGNSLLGVEKNLLNNHQFAELEQLKDRYFDETRPSEKERLKDKISNLIEAITQGGEFDYEIYFSEVFRLNRGFDVVIGNPPWGSKLSKEEKAKLKERYKEIDSSTPNSFAYFIGLSFKISKGNVAFVLPDSILIKDFSKTRKLLREKMSQLLWYQNIGVPEDLRPFLNVEHDVCVIISNQMPSKELLCYKQHYISSSKEFDRQRWYALKDDIIHEEFGHAFNLTLKQADLEILNKIRRFAPMSDLLQCHEGIHTGNSREALFKKDCFSEHCKELYYGGGAGDKIANYVSQRSGWFVDYRKEVIDKNKGMYASLRNENIFRLPKIYITRTGNPFKAFLDEGTYASNNFFSLQFKDYSRNNMESLKIILPFIVATITRYFIRKFAAPRLGDTFVETKIFHLLQFRIPEISDEQEEKIESEVNEIIEVKSQKDGDSTELESKLDRYIYSLYGLTPEEIVIVEEAV